MVSPVFIGRREELASLATLLIQASAREPAFALIGGEAGVGKTRLVRELIGRATDRGFLVLTGQCVELGAEGLPLAPLVDALRALARVMPPDELAAWGVLAIALAASTGAGAILVEILTETSLQRSLPADVFGRAYGLALPAAVAGIALGSLLAPVLVAMAGGSSAMIISGAVVVGYGLVLLRAGNRTHTELAVAGA